MMLGLFGKQEDRISAEIFKKEVSDLKIRLDMVEDDIKRLRKKSKIPENNAEEDEKIIKSLEDDGFKEIRALTKKYGDVPLG